MPRSVDMVTALILLPLSYNPDASGHRQPIEDEKFVATAEDIARKFGGGTLFVFRHDPPRGFWWDRGAIDYDIHAMLEVDLLDTPQNRSWLKAYARDVLMERFQQKAIYVKLVGPIQTFIVTSDDEDSTQ